MTQPVNAGRGPKMRIVVDLNRCLGYAQCVPLAPEVLQLNGEEALAYDPNPDESQRQQVAARGGVVPGAGDHRGDGSPVGPDDPMSTHPLIDELVRTFKAEGRIVIVGASLAGLRCRGSPAGRGLHRIADAHRRRGARTLRPAAAVQAGAQGVGAGRQHQAAADCARSTRTGGSVSRPPDWTVPTGKCCWPTATRCPTTGC